MGGKNVNGIPSWTKSESKFIPLTFNLPLQVICIQAICLILQIMFDCYNLTTNLSQLIWIVYGIQFH